jgi:hypothetical protein
MSHSNSGIKQWPLAGALVQTHGKQIVGPSTVMFDCAADGTGGWVERTASPIYRHEVRPTGEYMRETAAPIEAVYSINRLTSQEVRWV